MINIKKYYLTCVNNWENIFLNMMTQLMNIIMMKIIMNMNYFNDVSNDKFIFIEFSKRAFLVIPIQMTGVAISVNSYQQHFSFL
jgi:hypothetical protein